VGFAECGDAEHAPEGASHGAHAWGVGERGTLGNGTVRGCVVRA
jgi:hypothetical protein